MLNRASPDLYSVLVYRVALWAKFGRSGINQFFIEKLNYPYFLDLSSLLLGVLVTRINRVSGVGKFVTIGPIFSKSLPLCKSAWNQGL